MSTTELGRKGEEAAAAYLERTGMTVVERNWSCKGGEVDIVALDGESIVFVEVKTRASHRAGTPEEAVSPAKQKRYVKIANAYTSHAGVVDPIVRFDVIAITPIAEDRALLRHHRAAFDAS